MRAISILFTSFVLYCLAVPLAHADSIPGCATGLSISSLQQSGGCESGGLLFSNFRYNNSGLEISPLVFVTPSNVLVSATPFAITFSTDYGVGGGFSNCVSPQPISVSGSPGVCIEEEGSLGYDVSVVDGGEQIAGLALLGGYFQNSLGYAYVQEFGCLGAGNAASALGAGVTASPDFIRNTVCQDPSASASLLPSGFPDSLNGGQPLPSTILFAPVSTISIDIGLFVDPAGGGQPLTLPPFSNSLLLEPSKVPEPSTLLLLATGLLGIWGSKLQKKCSATRIDN